MSEGIVAPLLYGGCVVALVLLAWWLEQFRSLLSIWLLISSALVSADGASGSV